jgi:hypothetical protein
MTGRGAIQSKHDTQYSEVFDRIVAENPPQIAWRLNNRGIWVAVSVLETERARRVERPRERRVTQGTHCRRLHEYTDENTYITPSGAQMCRTCKAENQRKDREARRAAKKQQVEANGTLSLRDTARTEI